MVAQEPFLGAQKATSPARMAHGSEKQVEQFLWPAKQRRGLLQQLPLRLLKRLVADAQRELKTRS